MPKVAYIDKRFSKKSLAIIEKANEIIAEYAADGLQLTLRQLYYQFVSKALIENTQKSYNRLGSIINDARMAGYIDWMAIEDRTRNVQRNYHNTDPGQAVEDALHHFMLDHWADQPYRVEVWIEKEALIGVIAGICENLDVPYFACKGYVSQSEMWMAAQRFNHFRKGGQKVVVIHLGDHDPSGIDMTRDIEDRQTLFGIRGKDTIIERIALNMDQIEQYNPPPNPAKITDSRAEGYIDKYGEWSYELDALDPKTLRTLISDTVRKYRDEDIYNATIEKENEYKAILERVVDGWDEI
jgi:hypothetical protein